MIWMLHGRSRSFQSLTMPITLTAHRAMVRQPVTPRVPPPPGVRSVSRGEIIAANRFAECNESNCTSRLLTQARLLATVPRALDVQCLKAMARIASLTRTNRAV